MIAATRSLLALISILLMSACGFHLRGDAAIPEALQTLNLQGNSSSLMYQALVRQLRTNGITLVELPNEALYQIQLESESLDRRAASLNTRGKTEEYELRSRLRFNVFDNQGDSVTGPIEVSAERTYSYDEDKVNAMQVEEALLRQELRDNLAAQVIRRYVALSALKTQ